MLPARKYLSAVGIILVRIGQSSDAVELVVNAERVAIIFDVAGGLLLVTQLAVGLWARSSEGQEVLVLLVIARLLSDRDEFFDCVDRLLEETHACRLLSLECDLFLLQFFRASSHYFVVVLRDLLTY